MRAKPKKSSKVSAAAQLLEFARRKLSECREWPELHNAVYGVGAKFSQLFPGQSDRIAFSKSAEFREIAKLIESLPGPGDGRHDPPASGKLLVRLPSSVHRALITEAAQEGVSVTQLVVAKLSAQLREVVRI